MSTETDEFAARLAKSRRESGFASPREAAQAHGWNENTYKSRENGIRGIPDQDEVRRYAKAFDVPFVWLLTGEEPPPMSVVTIMGRIGAGAQIDVGVEQVPEGGEQIETVLPLPAGAIGFEVVGDSMWPRYDPGDVIVCEAKGTPIDNIPEGDEAAVKTSDGMRYLKRVYRGQPDGYFNLISHNAPPIQGAQLDWAADVLAVIRSSKWRRITDADRRRLAKKAMAGR